MSAGTELWLLEIIFLSLFGPIIYLLAWRPPDEFSGIDRIRRHIEPPRVKPAGLPVRKATIGATPSLICVHGSTRSTTEK